MNFPYFGDAESYLAIGAQCARHVATDAFTACYHTIRPIGAVAYFSIPYLLTDDPVTAHYLLAGLNVLMLMALCNVLMRLSGAPSARPGLWRPRDLFVALLATAICLPFIPVALSDLPAATFFVLGLYYLLRSTADLKAAFIGGLFMGISCLVKQNYYVFSAMAFAIFTTINMRRLDRATVRHLSAFGAGFLVAMVQIAWVYLHSGHVYPYEPSLNADFANIRKLPFVEMVAYSWPSNNAYVSQVDTTAVSGFSHFCIKLLQGFFAYRPAVYLGAPPAGSPVYLHVDAAFLVKAYAAAFLVIAGLLWAAAISDRGNRAIVLVILASTVFTAWYIHVENRYFLLPKLLLIAWLGTVVLPAAAARFAASAREAIFSNGPVAQANGSGTRQPLNSRYAFVAYAFVTTICFLAFQHEGLTLALQDAASRLRAGHELGPRTLAGAVFLVKLCMVGCFAATAYMVGKAASLIAQEPSQGRRAAAVFATSPLAVFPVFFMGHYETLGAFFVAWSIYFCLRRRTSASVLALAPAVVLVHPAAVLLIPLSLIALKRWASEADRQKATVLWCSGALAIALVMAGWHPQRLILAVPLLALAMLYVKRPAVFYSIEVLAVAAFVCLCANLGGAALDVGMLQEGVFRKLFPVVYLHNADLLPAHGLLLMKAVICAYLFSPLAVLAWERLSADYANYVAADDWLLGRWIVGMALVIAPTVYCAFAPQWQSAEAMEQAALSRFPVGSMVEGTDRSVGELVAGRKVSQSFVADKNGLAGISLRFATYARINQGEIRIVLKDEGGAVLATRSVDAGKLRDNVFHAFRIPPIADSAGRKMVLDIQSSDGVPGHAATLWAQDGAGKLEHATLTVGGATYNGVLNLRLLYLP